jgi:hypothetical protein
MYPARPSPQGKSGISETWNGVAAVVAVVATFFITPMFFQITVGWVRDFAVSQYGYDWEDAAGLLWGIVSVFLIYWVSNLLAQEFLIKRGINTFIR